jgi:hypothetical protein
MVFPKTKHNGTINTDETRYSSGNSHIIKSDLPITKAIILTIEADCLVKLNGNYQYWLDRYFIANGSKNRITFTSNQVMS